MGKIYGFPLNKYKFNPIPNLELERSEGYEVTQEAYEKFVAELPLTKEQLEQLDVLVLNLVMHATMSALIQGAEMARNEKKNGK